MVQSSQISENERLHRQYTNKSDKELSEIIKPENGYTETAVKVASDILHSDRTKYYEKIEHQQNKTDKLSKIDNDELFLEMRNDIRSIKYMVLFFVILTVIALISTFYTVYVTIPNLF